MTSARCPACGGSTTHAPPAEPAGAGLRERAYRNGFSDGLNMGLLPDPEAAEPAGATGLREAELDALRDGLQRCSERVVALLAAEKKTR